MEFQLLNLNCDLPDSFDYPLIPLPIRQSNSMDSLFSSNFSFDFDALPPFHSMEESLEHSSISPALMTAEFNSLHQIMESELNSGFSTLSSLDSSSLNTMSAFPPFNSRSQSGSFSSSHSSQSELMSLDLMNHARKQSFIDLFPQPMMMHCQESLFNCGSCPASFKRNAELRRHITSIHFKIKTFVCNECSTAFGRKDALKRHMHSRVAGKSCAGTRRRASKYEHGITSSGSNAVYPHLNMSMIDNSHCNTSPVELLTALF